MRTAARRIPVVAVPAVAGVAAAICITPQALAATTAESAPSAAQTFSSAARHASVADRADPPAKAAALVSSDQAQSTKYTVRKGDSLSSIAQKVYHQRAAWPVIYYANRDKVHWANEIDAGQVLKIPAKPAKLPAAPGQLGPATSRVTVAQPSTGYATATAAVASSSYSGGGGFQSCVISRESGGSSQVMNSSGHYGLYQFSEGTWEAYGGSASDFGHASVSEQNQVFNTAISRGGQSNWSAYDGC